MSDHIESMRTYFWAAGHELDVVHFAESMLAASKRAISRQIAEVGIFPAEGVARLGIQLGDPDAPVDRPVKAYVNASEWKARCECGGVEYVDLELPLFMCCGCWNAADGHAWRPVVVPTAEEREAIEDVLLARPDPQTRHWRDNETVRDIERENEERGLPKRAEAPTSAGTGARDGD